MITRYLSSTFGLCWSKAGFPIHPVQRTQRTQRNSRRPNYRNCMTQWT